jgi:hypothetical protein
MADKEILTSKLLEPGAIFTVTDAVKDSSFPPGSLGFVSFISGIDDSFQDIARVSVVMIRKGKTGKARVLNTTLHVPIFYVDHKGFNKLLPEDGVRKCYVHIERHMAPAMDLMEIPPLMFLGYAVALSRRIKHMSDQCRHKKWPEAKGHPINIMRQLSGYFEEDPDGLIEKYATAPFRLDFMNKARYMVSSLIRMQIQLDMSRASAEINAAEFLVFTNKGEFIPEDAKEKENEYKFTDDDAMLKRTLSFHKKLRSNIETLFKNKKNKNS